MLIVFPLLNKILDISDVMLDSALDICQNHLNSSKMHMDEHEYESGVTSDDNSSEVSSRQEESPTGTLNVQFHVFAPPELCQNIENWDFGITGSFNDWNTDSISVLSREKHLTNGGWLLNGQVKLPSATKEIQYKYILKDRTNNHCIWELLPTESDGNRVLNIATHLKNLVVFDGIMLPHVHNKELFDKYHEETLGIMLRELIDNCNTTDTLESVKESLNSVTEDLKRVYKLDEQHFNNALCRSLMEILNEKNDKKLSFIWATAFLANRNEIFTRNPDLKWKHWTLNPENLNAVLKSLNLIEIRDE